MAIEGNGLVMDEQMERQVRDAADGMEFVDVASKSGNMAKIGYDLNARVLVVEFGSGKRYGYAKVPNDVGDQLVRFASSEKVSTGTMFAEHIRGKVPYIQL